MCPTADLFEVSTVTPIHHASPNFSIGMQSYVGGVYETGGLSAVRSWLYPLFHPYIEQAYRCIRVQHGLSAEPEPIPELASAPVSSATLPDPNTTWSNPPPARQTPSIGHLSLFNQYMQQQGKSTEWVYTDSAGEGTKTTPIWVVRAMVGPDCLGHGRGSTKKAAKNEAAKVALRKMGVYVPCVVFPMTLLYG